MTNERMLFQLATHNLAKIAIKLECFFYIIEQACDDTHPVIHHYALKNILEIMTLAEKPELKSRFLKELIRIEHVLNTKGIKISNLPYGDVSEQIQRLSGICGGFGGSIHHNVFLQSLRLAHRTSHDETEFNAPQFLYWLEGRSSKRQQDLRDWFEELLHLRDSVATYLGLFRNTAIFEQINILNGFYHCQLTGKSTCHLVLLKLDRSSGFIPKVHVGHHGLTIRLNDAATLEEVKPESLLLEVAICQL